MSLTELFAPNIWLSALAIGLVFCGLGFIYAILTRKARHSLPILLWILPVLSFAGAGLAVYFMSV